MPRRHRRLRPAGRTSAAASSRSGQTSACAGTTTSASAATLDLDDSRRTRLRPRSGRATCSATGRGVSGLARSRRASADGLAALPRAARATRSGSTSSPTRRRWPRSRQPRRRSCSSGTATPAGDRLATAASSTAATPRRNGDRARRSGRWLLNPGSVGQPRDGDPRAAWLLLDLDAGRASFRRVDYDDRGDAGGDQAKRGCRRSSATGSRPAPSGWRSWTTRRALARAPLRGLLGGAERRCPRGRERAGLPPAPCRSAT